MRFMASEIAAAVDGEIFGRDVEVDGVSTDTRNLAPGQLFVPLRGAVDGHKFLIEANRAGASAFLTESSRVGNATAIRVDDTARALLQLGALARTRLNDRVVGITGSVGKTTTKSLLGSIVENVGAATISRSSFNNEIGLPLTLCNASPDTFTTVVEMGARNTGNIARLCEVAQPSIGVVTAVGLAHMGTFGSIGAVARTKGELVEALPANGTAVLNIGDELVYQMRERTSARIITFGLDAGDIRASRVAFDDKLRPSFRLHTIGGQVQVRLPLAGVHNIVNALAATAAAIALRVSVGNIVEGLEAATNEEHRMSVVTSRTGFTIIDDTYNANPMSMEAALRALAAFGADGRRIAVLGEMVELGDVSAEQHESIAQLADLLGIEVIAVNTGAYGTEPVDVDDIAVATGELGRSDVVLVKASRTSQLDRVAAILEHL